MGALQNQVTNTTFLNLVLCFPISFSVLMANCTLEWIWKLVVLTIRNKVLGNPISDRSTAPGRAKLGGEGATPAAEHCVLAEGNTVSKSYHVLGNYLKHHPLNIFLNLSSLHDRDK